MDNAGAVLDLKILYNLMDENIPFLLEVTNRKTTDNRGGIILKNKNSKRLQLIELSQVEKSKLEDLDPHKFELWNTNNIWVNLGILKEFFIGEKKDEWKMDVIINKRSQNLASDDLGQFIQLEIPVGMFSNPIFFLFMMIFIC